MNSSEKQHRIAKQDFSVSAKVHGNPANMIRGVLYFPSDVEFLVMAGDTVEMLPGGYFVSRPNDFTRKQITTSANNAYLINEYCS